VADCRGFTLVEMMIAVFILSFSVLGLLSMTLTSIRVNQENEIRNTAIRLTNQVSEILLAQPMNSTAIAVSCAPCSLTPYNSTNGALGANFAQFPNPVQTIRGYTQNYTVRWTVQDLSNDLKQINMTVSYTYRGQTYTNNTVIYKHRAV